MGVILVGIEQLIAQNEPLFDRAAVAQGDELEPGKLLGQLGVTRGRLLEGGECRLVIALTVNRKDLFATTLTLRSLVFSTAAPWPWRSRPSRRR